MGLCADLKQLLVTLGVLSLDKSVEGSSGKQPTGPTLRCEVEEIFPGIGVESVPAR